MSVLAHFEEYQKARVKFVQAVAEAATRPQNIEVMSNAGVMQLHRPLLLDNVPSIQQTAALALGRLANYSKTSLRAWWATRFYPNWFTRFRSKTYVIRILINLIYIEFLFQLVTRRPVFLIETVINPPLSLPSTPHPTHPHT